MASDRDDRLPPWLQWSERRSRTRTCSAVPLPDARPRSGCRSDRNGGTHASLHRQGDGRSPPERTARSGGAASSRPRGASRSDVLARSMAARATPAFVRRSSTIWRWQPSSHSSGESGPDRWFGGRVRPCRGGGLAGPASPRRRGARGARERRVLDGDRPGRRHEPPIRARTLGTMTAARGPRAGVLEGFVGCCSDDRSGLDSAAGLRPSRKARANCAICVYEVTDDTVRVWSLGKVPR